MATVITILWIIGVICWFIGFAKSHLGPSVATWDWLCAGLAFFGTGLVVARL